MIMMVSCGYNGYGNLGMGDTNHRGDGNNEMGDLLPFVDLGTDFVVMDMTFSSQHSCM